MIPVKKFGGEQPQTLAAFGDANGLTLVAKERSSRVPLATARPLLRPRATLARQIAGQRIAVGAHTEARREIDVPNDLRHEE